MYKILILVLMFPCYAQASLEYLVGQRYDRLDEKFNELDVLGGSCLLECEYALKRVTYDESKYGLVLSKKTIRSPNYKWLVVDVLSAIKLADSEQLFTHNCTKSFKKYKKLLESRTIMSSINLVAIAKYPEVTRSQLDFWVPASKAFVINEETDKLEEIPVSDVYCFAGVG